MRLLSSGLLFTARWMTAADNTSAASVRSRASRAGSSPSAFRAVSRSASICVVFAGCVAQPVFHRRRHKRMASPRGEARMRAMLGDGGGDALMSALDLLVVVQAAARLSGLADGVDQLRDALAAGGHRGQYRGAQFLGQFGDIDGNAARRGFVVHVQGEHHGHAEFGQQGAQGSACGAGSWRRPPAQGSVPARRAGRAWWRVRRRCARAGRGHPACRAVRRWSKRAVARVTSTVVPG
jgi:hypothetical protein